METVSDRKLEVYEISLVVIMFLTLIIILPLVGLSDLLYGIMLLSCIVVIGILFGRMHSEGNIGDYSKKKDNSLIWNDKKLAEDISYHDMVENLKAAAIVEVASLILFLISLYHLGGIALLNSNTTGAITNAKSYIDIFTVSFLAMVLSFIFVLIIFVNMLMKKFGAFAPRELRVYNGGLRILNRFIPWEELHSISRPNHYKYSENLSRIIVLIATMLSYNGFSHVKYPMYKIIERNGKVHIVPISDIDGLNDVLIKCGQEKVKR